ncbi:MAG: hypothetical protein CMJ58_04985 [Planctomycetaceae bacterium]|nr:hypothetical protein [Planctomycetaceae bacterium]
MNNADPPADPDLETALEAQQALLETCLPQVFAEYDDAIRRGVKQPVVVVVDCEDGIGGQIARAWAGDDEVDAAIAEQQQDRTSGDETTTLSRAVSFAEAKREIPQVFPYLEPVFAAPPRDGFLAISVTAGGASALTVPPDARED